MLKGKRKQSVKPIFAIMFALLFPVAGIILRDAPLVWPLSVLIYNIGLLYSFSLVTRKVTRIISYVFVSSLLFVIEDSYFLSYYLQGKGFNEAFFYHLRLDLFQAGIGEYLPVIVMLIVCLFCFIIITLSYLSKGPPKRGWKHSFAFILIVAGLVLSPPAKALVRYADNQLFIKHKRKFFKHFPEIKANQISAVFAKERKYNVVMIYVESLNQSYFDEITFPGLLPQLRQVKEQSIDFTNISQGEGASWTIGGIVASQCGYPLTASPYMDDDNTGILSEFLPGATCLGDILAGDGYRLSFIGGADSRFAGKGEFLRSHGYSEVIGRDELLEAATDETYYNKWGAFDDTLFDVAIQKFEALSSEKSPFLMTLLTLDTHDGYVSRSCGSYEHDPSLEAYHCSDLLVSRFIRQIRNSPYSENTMIIVLNDHLEQANQGSDHLTFFVNTPAGEKARNSNAGLHYDIAPTILEFMGYRLDGQIGFGSSLVSGPGYLPGKFGQNGWQEHSTALMAIGKSLWNELVFLDGKGLRFTASDLSLSLGGREFDLPRGWKNGVAHPSPTIFIFDAQSLKLTKIKTSSHKVKLTPVTLGRELLQNKENLVFAISLAGNFPWFYDPRRMRPEQLAFFFGKPGGESFSWGPITGDFVIPFDMINELSHSKIDLKRVLRRKAILDEFEQVIAAREKSKKGGF